MRNRGSPFDEIILYLVAVWVVIGFIAFGAYDVLGGARGRQVAPSCRWRRDHLRHYEPKCRFDCCSSTNHHNDAAGGPHAAHPG